MEKFRESLSKLKDLDENIWDEISKKITIRNYNKGDIILKKGRVERYISFVNKGYARSVRYMNNEDKTFDFFFPNEYMSSWSSFFDENASIYQFEALEDLELISISNTDIWKLTSKTPDLKYIIKLTMSEIINKKNDKISSLIFLTPEERYLELYEKRPELIKVIPLQYLACYIGIRPESLSRIRKRIFKVNN